MPRYSNDLLLKILVLDIKFKEFNYSSYRNGSRAANRPF